MLRSPRLLTTGLVFFCAFIIFALWRLNPKDQISYLAEKASKLKQSPAIRFRADAARIKDVRNLTLGFEKVFILNLPERPDKLDQFTLLSSLTGFKIDVIEGVKGEEVLNKSLPALEGLPAKQRSRNNIVGCWRAHQNFAQKIVNDRLSSALVMEDDADWDTGLKHQLDLFAQGSQFVTGVQPGHKPHSPYGDDWDLIWLGHCASQIKPDDQRRFIIENDATVPPMARRVNFAKVPDMNLEGYDNSSRIIYRAQRGLCLYAYALSYRGAQKMLRDQARMTKFAPIDIAIGDWCESDPDVKCIGVFPQLIDSHKAAGRLSRDSDIGSYSADEYRHRGYTFNIVHSTRLNVDHLVDGEWDRIERQWPTDPEVIGPPRPKPMSRIAT